MAPAHPKWLRSDRAFSQRDELRMRQRAGRNVGRRDSIDGDSEDSEDDNDSPNHSSQKGLDMKPNASTVSFPKKPATVVVETVTQSPASLLRTTTAAWPTLTAFPSILQNPVAEPTVSSRFISTTSKVPVLPLSSLLPTSTRGRKGVYGDNGDDGYDEAKTMAAEMPNTTFKTSMPSNTENVAAAETQPSSALSVTNNGNHLSDGAAHALIVVGTIGGMILVAFIVYITLHLLKIDLRSKFRQRKQPSGGPGLDGPYWKPKEFDAQSFETVLEEKHIPRQKQLQAFVDAGASSSTTTITEVQLADAERQARVRSALLENYGRDGGLHVLNPDPVLPSPGIAPSVMPLATGLATRTRSRPPSAYLNNNNNNNDPLTSAPNYINTSRISDLSSLSSGFGDAKIDVPESGPSLPGTINTTRTSIMNRGNKDSSFFGRFSVMRDPGSSYQSGRRGSETRGNRDTTYTTYTTTSEDSEPPRFRGVNSWVNQQSSRITRKASRQDEAEDEIRNMPSLPAAPARHQRGDSEITNPAFKYHPGDEIPVVKGSRVPSAILNKL